jgi:hypothetical protein
LLLKGFLKVEHRAIVGNGDLNGESVVGAVDDLRGHHQAPSLLIETQPDCTAKRQWRLHHSSVTPDLKIGGMILVGGPENQPAPKDQGLWSGTRSSQGLQLSPLNVRQRNCFREWKRHE